MSIRPVKLLKVNINSISTAANWTYGVDTDAHYNTPYRWNINMSVYPQTHSSSDTRIPNVYDGVDIQIGDWITNSTNGCASKIISIISKNTSQVQCVVEDIDRYNTFNNPTQSGSGSLAQGTAIVFEMDALGLPVLTGLEANLLTPTIQADLISRFSSRNSKTLSVPFHQTNHGLSVGDVIFIDSSDGLIKKAVANSEKVRNLIGIVNEIGVPSSDDFTFRPLGQVVDGISPALPGVQGSMIYLHTMNAGALTSTKPDSFAQPVYIQLNSSGTVGLLLQRGIDLTGPAGRASAIQVVGTISLRNALTVKNGDQVFVSDTGEGEWALFLYNDGEFTLISDQDNAGIDSRTESVIVTKTSPSVVEIYRVSPGIRITTITVDVNEAFSTNASLYIGDNGVNNRLMDDVEVDLSVVGPYSASTSYQYGGTTETVVKAYFDAADSASGSMKITISYS